MFASVSKLTPTSVNSETRGVVEPSDPEIGGVSTLTPDVRLSGHTLLDLLAFHNADDRVSAAFRPKSSRSS